MDELEIPSGLLITRSEEGVADAGGREVRVVPLWKWMLEGHAPQGGARFLDAVHEGATS